MILETFGSAEDNRAIRAKIFRETKSFRDHVTEGNRNFMANLAYEAVTAGVNLTALRYSVYNDPLSRSRAGRRGDMPESPGISIGASSTGRE